jgi:hypothetical protein
VVVVAVDRVIPANQRRASVKVEEVVAVRAAAAAAVRGVRLGALTEAAASTTAKWYSQGHGTKLCCLGAIAAAAAAAAATSLAVGVGLEWLERQLL